MQILSDQDWINKIAMTQTMIFAHRGAKMEAPENTRSAFNRALEYAIDGIETDVQLSRDEVAVLWHDRFLDKVGLPDKHVDDFDYAQLQVMNFAAHFSSNRHGASNTPKHESAYACRFPHPPSTSSGQAKPPPQVGEGTNESLRELQIKAEQEGIMSLKEFLDAYRKRCRLLIEIKNRAWETSSRHEIKVRQTLEMIGARTSCPQMSWQDVRVPAVTATVLPPLMKPAMTDSLSSILSRKRATLNQTLSQGERVRSPFPPMGERWIEGWKRSNRDASFTSSDAVMVSSFNLASLVYAHHCAPGFPLVYNLESDQKLIDAQLALVEHPFLHGLCLPIESLDDGMVRLLRSHDKCIAVYTCNSDEEINKALGLGVDILISDVPQKALQMRDR